MSGWNNDDDGLLEGGLDDDDFVDDYDDADDGALEHGGSSPEQPPPNRPEPASGHNGHAPRRLRMPQRQSRHKQAYRLRAMSPNMMETFPDVSSLLITRKDGSQILFVRKG